MSFLEVLDRARRRDQVAAAPRGAPRRWSASTWTTPRSSTSSTGRCARRRRSRALIAAGYSSDFNGEAYHTVSGQNSNNSVRVTDDFMQARRADGDVADDVRAPPARSSRRYERARTSGARSPRPRGAAPIPACSTTPRSTSWHTCPNTGTHQRVEPVLRVHVPRRHGLQPGVAQPDQVPARRRRASTSRATATPAASSSSRRRSWSTSRRYPTERRSRRTRHDYRPLGLGYANLGTLLMVHGHPVRQRRGPRRSPPRSPRS